MIHVGDTILLNQIETCAALGVSRFILRQFTASDDFPAPVFLNRRALWKLNEIREWRERRLSQPTSQATLSITAGADPNASIERRKDSA